MVKKSQNLNNLVCDQPQSTQKRGNLHTSELSGSSLSLWVGILSPGSPWSIFGRQGCHIGNMSSYSYLITAVLSHWLAKVHTFFKSVVCLLFWYATKKNILKNYNNVHKKQLFGPGRTRS